MLRACILLFNQDLKQLFIFTFHLQMLRGWFAVFNRRLLVHPLFACKEMEVWSSQFTQAICQTINGSETSLA